MPAKWPARSGSMGRSRSISVSQDTRLNELRLDDGHQPGTLDSHLHTALPAVVTARTVHDQAALLEVAGHHGDQRVGDAKVASDVPWDLPAVRAEAAQDHPLHRIDAMDLDDLA